MGTFANYYAQQQLIKLRADWESYLQLAHALGVPQERAQQIFREEEAITMSSPMRRGEDTYRCAKRRVIEEGK